MLIARVVGTVVATRKDNSHEGRKALLLQPLRIDGTEGGARILALDGVGAGVGERVLVVQEGWSAATAVDREGSAIDAAVVAIVDELSLIDEVALA
jgi:ethanolamine utilization protein EutN